jgi:site-specific DNA-methyltransferase (adenine-specific)
LRDYGIKDQIGLEDTLTKFINRLVAVFSEVKRVLKSDGTMWIIMGDAYTSGNRGWRAPDKKNKARAMKTRPKTPKGLKPKDLIGIPWRLAFELQNNGWYLRRDIIWYKPNAMPESVLDRPNCSHEYIFLLSKSKKYFYNNAVKEENGDIRRNRQSVWKISTRPSAYGHTAAFPRQLIEPCILAGTEIEDFVLDPFFGSGTVGIVCQLLGRKFIGIEINPDYIKISKKRLRNSSRKNEMKN